MNRAQILRSGLLCTIQDLGRKGGHRQGVSPGGAMDRRSLLWANHLLGNEPGAPALEVTLGGLSLEFEQPTVLAITGAECRPVTSNRSVGDWRTIYVEAKSTLILGFPKAGLRTYLAFPGGLQADKFFGSASTVLREGLPGRLGSALAPGDLLSWPGQQTVNRSVPRAFATLPGETLELPFLRGFDWEAFSGEDRRILLASEWVVSTRSDRVATRLDGPSLESGPRVLDSTPMVDGTLQVLPTGKPIIFMRDRPTMGGYPKLGSVVPEALDHLAQVGSGTRIRFVLGDAREARSSMRSVEDFFGLAGG